MEYLLAAEADRIQHLLFRSSQLREVVGGSQLLSRFCEQMPGLLGQALGVKPVIISSGGGSFRIKFETENDARRFGAALAEAYYRAMGSTLSVADPVPMTGAYGPASRNAGEELAQAKRQGVPVATTQMPYVAFCESCGIGLAEAHERRLPEERESHYLCHSCRVKIAEREEHSQEGFLRKFYDQAKSRAESRAPWPPTPEPEDIARHDPRDYVAYVVADGDGMGRVFESCNESQAHALSNQMDKVLRDALANPTARLMDRIPAGQVSCIPVLPLILGGDDLFALVPARWGLDFARRLCETFQDEMTAFVREQEITLDREGDDKERDVQEELTITMSAAVVICKANYPYYLAHQIGEERLGETKRAVKALANEGPHFSAVDFDVVLGSQAAPDEPRGQWRPTLRPYWVTRDEVPIGWGLSVDDLLTWRRKLVGTPSRRRSQLREHFDRVSPRGRADHWNEGLTRILRRIERDESPGSESPVRRAVKALGGLSLEDWYPLDRKNDQDFWHGHGFPDLLRAWDWMLNLRHPTGEYEGGEQ